jgi:endonuclease-8
MLTGRLVEAVEPYGKHLFYVFEGDVLLHVHLGPVRQLDQRPAAAAAPRGALRLRLTTDDHWLDLRGPTACELYTPAGPGPGAGPAGPRPAAQGRRPGSPGQRISRSRTAIGALLMDQSVLAGVGQRLPRRGALPGRAVAVPGRQGRAGAHLGRHVGGPQGAAARRGAAGAHRHDASARTATGAAARRGARTGFYVYRRHGQPCRRCGAEVRPR